MLRPTGEDTWGMRKGPGEEVAKHKIWIVLEECLRQGLQMYRIKKQNEYINFLDLLKANEILGTVGRGVCFGTYKIKEYKC